MKRIKLCLAILAIIFFTLPSNVFAYDLYGYKLVNGVGDYGNDKQYYYITSSVSEGSSLDLNIGYAIDSWIYTSSDPGVTTPISFRETSYISSSMMDIYHGYFYPEFSGILAETLHYSDGSNGNVVNPHYTNWVWTEINLNEPSFNNIYYYDQRGTIAHEVGHVMGLAHTYNDYYVMTQLGEGRAVYEPSANDLHGINALY